jgi:DNA-binding NarL/FixJ family response regulator
MSGTNPDGSLRSPEEERPVRILIADDHSLFRESLKSLLTSRGFEIVGEAREGREAVDLARSLEPDLVLMDLSMPGLDGLSATRLISAEMPQVKVVVLTGSDEDAQLFEAIKSGAQGYLLKSVDSRDFFALLEGVGRGEPALTPALAGKLLQEFAHPARPAAELHDPDELTDREQEVLRLLVSGVTSNSELARELGVSENTVKFHVRNILDKLHLHNRAQVVGFALRHGIVAPPDGAR